MSVQEFWTCCARVLICCFFFVLFNWTYRILTKSLFPSLSCHLVEARDNVLGQNSVKFTWRPSSMSWSPNIGIYISYFFLRKNVAYHGDRESKMIMLLVINVTDGQRWREDVSLEVQFYYSQMVFIFRFHQSMIEFAEVDWKINESPFQERKKKKKTICIQSSVGSKEKKKTGAIPFCFCYFVRADTFLSG
jgi:hypothetical protein